MRRIWTVGALMHLTLSAFAQLTPPERQGLADALFLSNLEIGNLTAQRSTTGPMWARTAIDDPLMGQEQLTALQTLAGQRNLPQLLAHVRTKVVADSDSAVPAKGSEIEIPGEVPESLRPSLQRLIEALRQSNELVRLALQKLTSVERRTLIEALPRQAVGNAPIKFDFVRQPMPENQIVLDLVSRIDLASLRTAGQHLAQAVQEEIPKLREAAKTAGLAGIAKLNIQGFVVELGGPGDDSHSDTDAVLCIDLGGNDRYSGRYGAGVGYSGVLIDLGGDDTYESPDLSIGAGVLGVGIAYDLGGDDRFKGKSICFGSGICGVGALLKEGGDDDYRAMSMSQGFSFHGIGLLLDTKGDDQYRVGLLGQGSAKANGLGWLIDKDGNDGYRSGGILESAYFEGLTVSTSQGAGDGPGAVGILSELTGLETYNGGMYAQGSGRRGGIGALLDQKGNDAYTADRDAQASGAQQGAGFLWDASGDDLYTLRSGNGHGFGHDHGVGFHLDSSGNDLYAAHDSRPATASANGLAIFIDVSGDDRYQGPPGIGEIARGGGSIGVFADLSGRDQYAEGLADGRARAEPSWGSALDIAGVGPRIEIPDAPKPGSKPLPDDASMESIFRRAINDDRVAIDELTAIGEPALRWILAKELSDSDPSVVSLAVWLATVLGESAESVCVAAIDLSKEDQARAAIQICQDTGFRTASPKILAALEIPSLTNAAVRACGVLGLAESVPKLMALSDSSNPQTKRLSILALGQIGDERSLAVLEPQLDSSDPNFRRAAIEVFVKFPARALAKAKSMVTSSVEKTARTGIELLAAIVGDEALQEVGKGLRDPRRGVVIQSLLALDGRVPKEFRPLLINLRKSPDPLVSAVALRIDQGR
ncbi:MAG: HEAT repeat domain-containing protein [Chlorobia bacterium]|nr:HEAT repeat domain-containing protein [Fimbriimonadaceae bacterium]